MDYPPYRRTNNGITIYTTLISVDLAHEIFRAKLAISTKGGIIEINQLVNTSIRVIYFLSLK